MTPASFDHQLAYIHMVLEVAVGPEQTAMLLSIAESIKTARDHALNCAKAHKLEEV